MFICMRFVDKETTNLLRHGKRFKLHFFITMLANEKSLLTGGLTINTNPSLQGF